MLPDADSSHTYASAPERLEWREGGELRLDEFNVSRYQMNNTTPYWEEGAWSGSMQDAAFQSSSIK